MKHSYRNYVCFSVTTRKMILFSKGDKPPQTKGWCKRYGDLLTIGFRGSKRISNLALTRLLFKGKTAVNYLICVNCYTKVLFFNHNCVGNDNFDSIRKSICLITIFVLWWGKQKTLHFTFKYLWPLYIM